MTVASEVQRGQGVFVTGEFLSLRPGRIREDKEGNQREPGLVKLLVGDQPQTIEYWDEDAAQAALGTVERGDVITLGVYARAYKDRVYWRGISPRERD